MDKGILAVIMVFSVVLSAIIGGVALEKIWKGPTPSVHVQMAQETRESGEP